MIFTEDGQFRSKMSFSQQKAIFAAYFAAAKWGELCCKMALMCQRGASQLRNTLRNGALVAKLGVFTLWDFVAVSQLRNEVTVLRNGTCVSRGCFAAAKIFAERGLRLRNDFAAK